MAEIRGTLVILARRRWRRRPLLKHEFHADFTLRASGGAEDLELVDVLSWLGRVRVNEVYEGEFN